MIKFEKLVMNNILSFQSAIFNFDDSGLILIEGKIGSGKSSIVEVLSWVLFGETSKNVKADDIVNNIENKNCYASLSFFVNDDLYKIVKTKKHDEFKDSTTLSKFINNTFKSISGSDQNDTHKEIEKLLGMDYKTFRNSIFLNTSGKSFAEMTDKEIKQIFDNILNFDMINKLQELNKQEIDNINKHISKLESEKNNYEIRHNEKKSNVDKMNMQLSTLKAEFDVTENKITNDNLYYEKKLSDLKSELLKLGDINNDLKITNESILKYENSIFDTNDLLNKLFMNYSGLNVKISTNKALLNNYNDKLSSFSKIDSARLKTTIKDYEKRIVEIRKQISEIETDIEELETKKQEKNLMFLKLNAGNKEMSKSISDVSNLCKCPTCQQEVSETYKTNFEKSLRKIIKQNEIIAENIKSEINNLYDKIKQLKGNITFLVDDIDKIKQDINNVNNDLLKVDEKNKLQDKIKTLEIENINYNKELSEINIQQKEYQLKLDKYSKKLKDFQDIKESLRESAVKHAELSSQINELELNIKHNNEILKNLKITLDNHIKNIELIIFDMNKFNENIEILNNEICCTNDELKYYQFFGTMFSNQGVKSAMLNNVTPMLNTIAQDFSNQITDGKIQIEFETQTFIKSTKIWKEKFEIKVKNLCGGTNYKSNSSGERALIDLCILEALQFLVSSRSGNSMNIKFFDEVFSCLDFETTEKVYEYLDNQSKEKSIYVISHDINLKNYFNDNNIISIEKKSGFSNIRRN